MSKYDVALCGKDDIAEVMGFFGEQWDEGHIFAADRTFVDYAFFNSRQDRYNIVLGRECVTGRVCGIIAYFPISSFDESISATEDFIWISNWLVAQDAKGNLGLMLYLKMQEAEACRSFGTLGQNKTAEGIYRRLGYQVGTLTQWFMVNKGKQEHRIISGYPIKVMSPEGQGEAAEDVQVHLELLDEAKIQRLSASDGQAPKKTGEYIVNKYCRSPYYDYSVYGIRKEGRVEGAVVLRAGKHNGAGYVRIVEYFGDVEGLRGSAAGFRQLLSALDGEYMDFYCYGIPDGLLYSAGFEKNEGQNGLIVPNYFEPFLDANITISFACKLDGQAAGLVLYKGDCDREHPRTTKGADA